MSWEDQPDLQMGQRINKQFLMKLPFLIKSAAKNSAKAMGGGANQPLDEVSVKAIATLDAYIQMRRSQKPRVVEATSLDAYSHEIVKFIMRQDAADRFDPDTGDKHAIIESIIGGDTGRDREVVIFMVCHKWQPSTLKQVEVLLNSTQRDDGFDRRVATLVTVYADNRETAF